MLKGCVKLGDWLGKSLFIAGRLSTRSTGPAKYLTSQVLLVPGLATSFEQPAYSNPQPKMPKFKMLTAILSPFCTLPNNTNKLIKDLYS